jgi:uncharacterized protein YjbJ (UPF0337 family)
MAKTKEKARSAKDTAEERSSWLANAVRFDRYGDALTGTGNMLVQKLPSSDDSRDSLVGTAQRAVDRARDTVSSAFDQLPDSLQNVPLPGRKQKKRRASRFVIIGVVVALATGGYFLYRWLNGGGQPMDYGIQESWPAEPNPGPVNEPREDDRQASLDAEESVSVLDATGTPARG